MNLTLTRKEYRDDGIFSELTDEKGNLVACTLEHAYAVTSRDPDRSWAPKIPIGKFTCKRGLHRLENMTQDFETFEITGVEGHSDLLFHFGNFNKDSSGCILLGTAFGQNGAQGAKMILCSRVAFKQFMELQSGVDSFELTVCAP